MCVVKGCVQKLNLKEVFSSQTDSKHRSVLFISLFDSRVFAELEDAFFFGVFI